MKQLNIFIIVISLFQFIYGYQRYNISVMTSNRCEINTRKHFDTLYSKREYNQILTDFQQLMDVGCKLNTNRWLVPILDACIKTGNAFFASKAWKYIVTDKMCSELPLEFHYLKLLYIYQGIGSSAY